jgi:hypothetical protein
METNFLLSSGSTNHFVESTANMGNLTICTKQVTIAAGKQILATHQGTFVSHCHTTCKKVQLETVLVEPGLQPTLLSLAVIAEAGLTVVLNR